MLCAAVTNFGFEPRSFLSDGNLLDSLSGGVELVCNQTRVEYLLSVTISTDTYAYCTTYITLGKVT